MSTLDLRLARQAANAAAVAEVLAALARRPWGPVAVAAPRTRPSRWPPGRCCGPNGVVSAELADEAAVRRLLAAARLWTAATSFGGVHSTIDRRAQWGADAVAPGFVPAVLRDRGHRRPRRGPSRCARRAGLSRPAQA